MNNSDEQTRADDPLVNAYNAPQVPQRTEPLPISEGAGQGQTELLVPGKTYRATYSTQWEQGGRTTYQVQGVGAFEISAATLCYLCGSDEQGRSRPCRHVNVTYGRAPRPATPQGQRQDLPVINRVQLAGGAHMDPTMPAPARFSAYRTRGRNRQEPAPDKTTAKLGVLVHALVQHWSGLAEVGLLRAAAVHALAVHRYREALSQQERIHQRIAQAQEELERAEARAGHQAALALASSYEQVAGLMQDPGEPKREFNVVGVCRYRDDEPTVVMVTRGHVAGEYDDGSGHGVSVCSATVYASSPVEAAELYRKDHGSWG